MAKRFVLFDIYSWLTPSEDPRRPHHHLARRGEEIEISDDEAARGEALGALGSAAEALESEAAASEPPSAPDEQLLGLGRDAVIAYLTQHPTEAGRIVELEQRRDRPRTSVLAAAERVRSAHEEAVAEQLEEQRRLEEEEQAAYAASQGSASVPQIPA